MQNAEQGNVDYAGRESLLRLEQDLKRYNTWIIETIFKTVPGAIQKSAAVLDFGAGIGTLSEIYYRRTGNRPHCVELDPVQRGILASRGFTAYEHIPTESQRYQIVFTSNVLEHIPDDLQVLKELRAVLEEDGRLLVYVPAFQILWTTMDDAVGHVRRYSRSQLVKQLEKAGYNVQYSGYRDSLGFLLAIAFKFLGRSKGEPSSSALRFYDRFLLPISRVMDVFFSGLLGKNLVAIAVPRA